MDRLMVANVFKFRNILLSISFVANAFNMQKYGHLIMSFENQKWSGNVPEVISEGLKFTNF